MEAEKPELMITDIVMQELTGIDLMEYITGSHRHTKVVVISGYDNFEYVRGSLQNGSVDYLLKPPGSGTAHRRCEKGSGELEEGGGPALHGAVPRGADPVHDQPVP